LHHKAECNPLLKDFPTPLRFLLRVMHLKTDTQAKSHLKDLKTFNQKVLKMVTMASQILHFTDKSKLATYAMIVFLRCPALSVCIENFKLIMHVYSLLEVNAFGVAGTRTQIRAGTGIYHPTNLLDHCCDPNAVIVYRGRQQFLIATRTIAEGDPVNISYIDQAVED